MLGEVWLTVLFVVPKKHIPATSEHREMCA